MLVLVSGYLSAQEPGGTVPRRWTGPAFGESTFEAEAIHFDGEKVRLRSKTKAGQRTRVISLERLSDDDQAYVLRTFANTEEPAGKDAGDGDISNHEGLLAAIEKYYETVDRVKVLYENELRKSMATAKRTGDIDAYNALEIELDYTLGEKGHLVSKFKPPARSTLLSRKAALQRAVETAKKSFDKSAKVIAGEFLKKGFVEQAREVDALIKTEYLPKWHISLIEAATQKPEGAGPLKMELNNSETTPVINVRQTLHDVPMAVLKRRYVGHASLVVSTDWRPDGTQIASMGYDGQAILWDASSGEKLMELTLGKRGEGIVFTPSGRKILVSSPDKIALWDTAENLITWETGGGSKFHFARISPDGELCCIGNPDGEKMLLVYRMEDGSLVQSFDNTGQPSPGGQFDSTGRLLAAAWGKGARVWDVKTWRLLFEFGGHFRDVRDVAFSPDNQWLLTGSLDGMVIIWNIRTGKPVRRLINMLQGVTGLAFSHDGTKLAVSRNDLGAVVFSTDTWLPYCRLPRNGNWASQRIAWSPDDREIVTGCDNGDVLISEIPNEEELAHYHKILAMFPELPEATLKTELSSQPESKAGFGRFSADGLSFAAVSRLESGANIFDVESGQSLRFLHFYATLGGIDFSPDGTTVAAGANNGNVVLWKVKNGEISWNAQAHDPNEIPSVRFSRDGSLIASGSADKTVTLQDVRTGNVVMRLRGHTKGVNTVAFAPDDKTIATAASDGKVILWDVATGEPLHCLMGHDRYDIRGLAFNGEGNVLASGSGEYVVLWDVRTGQPLRRLVGVAGIERSSTQGSVCALDFSPEGSRLAVASSNAYNSAVWDIETGLPLYRLPCRFGDIMTTTFSPDGKSLALCARDPIPIWNVPTDEELEQSQRDLDQDRWEAGEILLTRMPLEKGSIFQGYGPMRLEAKEFGNSIWAHAPSKHLFRLDKKWKTFKTVYGLRRGAYLEQADVVFVVKGDDRELFRSTVIRDNIERLIEINVSGVDRLELITEPGKSTHNDHGVWCTPKLFR